MSNPDDYTVGWICAINTEYLAGQTFFDKEHAPPAQLAEHDINHYTLGEINGHNVVMAGLPHGEYGTNSAASVVANLRNSFPKVRFGLMVGIGGGAPHGKNDIRLGNIVVSSPENGLPGVYHHDLGKILQGLPFEHTGYLDQAPRVIRSAITGLRTKFRRKGHHIDETIASILQTEPMLEEDFSRPTQESDRLFTFDFVHMSEVTCDESCATRLEKIITRSPRKANNDGPHIHYGIIASGNQLVKDAQMRDWYAREKDILCFEMEAAGIVNVIPSLIIRGIRDYSDSHKSKAWQGYAAMLDQIDTASQIYTFNMVIGKSPSGSSRQRLELFLSKPTSVEIVVYSHFVAIRSWQHDRNVYETDRSY
jgi:nucleoside phosphorylase